MEKLLEDILKYSREFHRYNTPEIIKPSETLKAEGVLDEHKMTRSVISFATRKADQYETVFKGLIERLKEDLGLLNEDLRKYSPNPLKGFMQDMHTLKANTVKAIEGAEDIGEYFYDATYNPNTKEARLEARAAAYEYIQRKLGWHKWVARKASKLAILRHDFRIKGHSSEKKRKLTKTAAEYTIAISVGGLPKSVFYAACKLAGVSPEKVTRTNLYTDPVINVVPSIAQYYIVARGAALLFETATGVEVPHALEKLAVGTLAAMRVDMVFKRISEYIKTGAYTPIRMSVLTPNAAPITIPLFSYEEYINNRAHYDPMISRIEERIQKLRNFVSKHLLSDDRKQKIDGLRKDIQDMNAYFLTISREDI